MSLNIFQSLDFHISLNCLKIALIYNSLKPGYILRPIKIQLENVSNGMIKSYNLEIGYQHQKFGYK